MMNTIENLWKSYDIVNEHIRFSDTKAGTILATNGIVVGLVLSNLIGAKSYLLQNMSLVIPLAIGGLTISISTFFALKCLLPTLSFGKHTKHTSLIYFGHIAQKYTNPSDYEKRAKETFSIEKRTIPQISEQIWINSQIAWKKFRSVTWATLFLGLTILIALFGSILTLL